MKLYVGNLSFETTENDLQGLFEQHGQVSEASLMMDRVTGKPLFRSDAVVRHMNIFAAPTTQGIMVAPGGGGGEAASLGHVPLRLQGDGKSGFAPIPPAINSVVG